MRLMVGSGPRSPPGSTTKKSHCCTVSCTVGCIRGKYIYIYVLVQYCCLYRFIYQVPVYFLFGDMYFCARFTVVV